MEQLDWPDKKRQMSRDQFQEPGRKEEHLKYLRQEVEKIKRVQPKDPKQSSTPKVETKNAAVEVGPNTDAEDTKQASLNANEGW